MYKTRNGAKYYIKRTNDFSPRDSMTGEQVVDIDWQESGFGRMVGGDYSGFWVSMADVTEITETQPPTDTDERMVQYKGEQVVRVWIPKP